MKTLIMVCMLVISFTLIKAQWTGRSTEVRTVSGRFAYNCEYQIAGSNQKIWKAFEGRCPSVIDVY